MPTELTTFNIFLILYVFSVIFVALYTQKCTIMAINHTKYIHCTLLITSGYTAVSICTTSITTSYQQWLMQRYKHMIAL